MLTYISKLLLLLSLVSTISCANIGNTRQEIYLDEDGGYTGLLVAIDERIPESFQFFNNIQVNERRGLFQHIAKKISNIDVPTKQLGQNNKNQL